MAQNELARSLAVALDPAEWLRELTGWRKPYKWQVELLRTGANTNWLVLVCRQSGKSSRRRRLARNPQKRMRTKPRGKVWSRKRRKNSSAVTVISRRLPLWA